MNVLSFLGRDESLFAEDLRDCREELTAGVEGASFLVIGGAGTIGQAVVKAIFARRPRVLHVVDVSENNLVELVRDIRSSLGYIEGDFRTLPLDCGSPEFYAFVDNFAYDCILNLSALKHVRSEKDPYSLMRMVGVNILNTERTASWAVDRGVKRYFSVSTDKAANPVNMMGASKRIMELFLMEKSRRLTIAMARFANVAFSDGSLLHGFHQRMQKRQPLSAPSDVRRYFMTAAEAGDLCLFSCLLAENRDIFFPKHVSELPAPSFSEIAERYLETMGYEPYVCGEEEEARRSVERLAREGKWPCYFFTSDTTGEKPLEEFFTAVEDVDLARFESIGIIRNRGDYDAAALREFRAEIARLRDRGHWSKKELVELFARVVPEFRHAETFKYLDERM